MDLFDFENKEATEVLWSYSRYKGRRTRAENKQLKLTDLQKRSFSVHSAEAIQKHLTELEGYTDKCSEISDWLKSTQHEQAKTYEDKCVKWKVENKVYSSHVLTMTHTSMQQVQNLTPQPIATKPVEGVRPSELVCDHPAFILWPASENDIIAGQNFRDLESNLLFHFMRYYTSLERNGIQHPTENLQTREQWRFFYISYTI